MILCRSLLPSLPLSLPLSSLPLVLSFSLLSLLLLSRLILWLFLVDYCHSHLTCLPSSLLYLWPKTIFNTEAGVNLKNFNDIFSGLESNDFWFPQSKHQSFYNNPTWPYSLVTMFSAPKTLSLRACSSASFWNAVHFCLKNFPLTTSISYLECSALRYPHDYMLLSSSGLGSNAIFSIGTYVSYLFAMKWFWPPRLILLSFLSVWQQSVYNVLWFLYIMNLLFILCLLLDSR